MEKINYGYGPHLMLDLNDAIQKSLDDLNACFQLLNELPPKIGMHKITQPYVFRYEGTFPGRRRHYRRGDYSRESYFSAYLPQEKFRFH